MRVLHLRNTCGYYGAERCITSWIDELVPRGWGFDLSVFDHPDPSVDEFLDRARGAGAEDVRRLPRGHGRAPAIVVDLARRIRRRAISVIHAHETRSHGIGWLVGGLTATPVVATVHGYVDTGPRSRRMNALNATFLGGRRFRALTVPNTRLAERWPNEAIVLPNGVPADASTGPRPAPTTPTFGVVARLSHEKGVDVFLDAISELPESWRFVVVGDGPDVGRLSAHPAAGRVRWEGFRADAADRMRAWTAVVLPSRSEGLPLTLLEAMARDVPVVATEVGGIPDVIDPGTTGRLVPPESPAALAGAMRAVVDDADATRAMIAAARERFDATYRIDRVGDRLDELYRSIADGAPR